LRGKSYFNSIKIDLKKPCLDYSDRSALFWRNITANRPHRARTPNTNRLFAEQTLVTVRIQLLSLDSTRGHSCAI